MSKSLKKLDEYFELEKKYNNEISNIIQKYNFKLAKSNIQSLKKLIRLLKKLK